MEMEDRPETTPEQPEASLKGQTTMEIDGDPVKTPQREASLKEEISAMEIEDHPTKQPETKNKKTQTGVSWSFRRSCSGKSGYKKLLYVVSITPLFLFFLFAVLYGDSQLKIKQLVTMRANCSRVSTAYPMFHGGVDVNRSIDLEMARAKVSERYLPNIFSELSVLEIDIAIALIKRNFGEHFGRMPAGRPSIDTDYIDVLDAIVPQKGDALRWLVNRNETVARRAFAIVVFANRTRNRYVKELEVNLDYLVVKTLRTIEYYQRRFDLPEYFALEDFLEAHLKSTGLEQVVYEIAGVEKSKCADQFWSCFKYIWSQPSITEVGGQPARRAWYRLYLNEPGFLLHPLPLEIMIDNMADDPRNWTVIEVLCRQQSFETSEDAAAQCINSSSSPTVKAKWDREAVMRHASYQDAKKRWAYKADSSPKPQQPPIGQNYEVRGHEVSFEDWHFFFELRTIQGLAVYDVRFRGTTVAHEVSMQDAVTFYFGHHGFSSALVFADGPYGFGFMTNRLVRGLDCPEYASMFDSRHYAEGRERYVSESVCLFVLDEATPLRRHVSSVAESQRVCNKNGGRHVTGVSQQVLVLRSVMTVYNYDYVVDYRFYASGVMETRVGLCGYVHSSRLYEANEYYSTNHAIQPHLWSLSSAMPTDFGYPLWSDALGAVIGQLHNHQMHFKVDLDVGQRRNKYTRIRVVHQDNGTNADDESLEFNLVRSEMSGVTNYSLDEPYFHLFSDTSGERTTRLHLDYNSIAKILALNHSEIAPGYSWMKYQVAVTKHKDNETRSSSVYTGVNPYSPQAVEMESYYRDNETIVEEDLVAWVTVGAQHPPRSEDMPSVQSLTATMKFMLIPFNTYEVDPSIDSPHSVSFCTEYDDHQ